MNKEDIYKFIKEKNIWYEIQEHKPLYTMQDVLDVKMKYPEYEAKNLFICDNYGKYYLVTVHGDKRLDLKEIKNKYGTGKLSFASQEDLIDILKLTPGSVTPLGLLNDEDLKVTFLIDKELFDGDGIIGVHPNKNDATIWMKTKDLVDIIESNGNNIIIMD